MNNLIRCLRYDWPLHFILLLTNWLPDNVKILKLRGLLIHSFFGSCGKALEIGRNVTFHNPANIHLGNDVFLAYGCMLLATDHIWIDDEVMFGPYCVVISGNHTRANKSFRYGLAELAAIHIGKGCWFGAHVVVTAGSKIGCGALIAAGAVVSGDIPSDVMAGGLPARAIKELGEE